MIRFAAALIALSVLAGCGLRGGLERPPPLFGSERARYMEEQKRKAEEEEAKKAAAAAGETTPAEPATGQRQRVEVPVQPAPTLQPTAPASPFRPN